MKSFDEFRQGLTEAKATYCGRCGTTHVPPSQGGTCPALKKEETELSEVAPGENLPGKATHLTNKDIRHPEHGIISGSTTLRHLGGNNYEVRAGRAKGKTIALDKQHVQKLSEEVELDEEIKKGDFVKDPQGKIHRVFGVKDNMLHTGEYRGKNTYGGTSMLHKTKAAKVAKPADVTEEVELEENDLHAQMAAFAAARGGKMTTQAQRKKDTDELIAKREKEAASRPKAEPQKIEPYKPLGGRDEKSGRSYSESVEYTQTQGDNMSGMDKYLAALEGNIDFRAALEEKKLTPAEMKKREEVAKAIERENPDMPMDKKMAIATATAKKVAEDVEQIDELSQDTLKSYVNKVAADAQKHDLNSTKRSPEKRNKSVAGFAKALNRLPHTPFFNKEDTHYCAKHVFSERFGEGFVVEGSHAEPDANGLIEWYDVDFGGTVRRVMTEKVKVMHAEYHMNHKKKMKEEEDADDKDDMKEAAKTHTVPKTAREKDLAALAEPKDKITHADVMVGRGVKKDAYPGYIQKGKELDAATKKIQASLDKRVKKEEAEIQEAMISYSDFQSKIDAHKKAGNKIKDDKYDKNKASYTVVDQEGVGKKITHTPSGTSQEHLGQVEKVKDAETQTTEKRGRGRPAGSKSGARN